MKARGDSITPVKIKQKLTGRIRLAFFQDDPEDERHAYSGVCGCLWGWLDRLSVKLTLCWIKEEGYNYGHVEMMFSNGTVVSSTVDGGGVHVLKDKLLSNKLYRRMLSVKVSTKTERIMLNEAHKLKGVPFNKLGRIWNNIKVLETIVTIDSGQESFYCSELITYLLQLGAKHESNDMCKDLDYRSTNPTQLFLNLTKTNYGKLDWNEKEAVARGLDIKGPSRFVSSLIFGDSKGKKEHSLAKII